MFHLGTGMDGMGSGTEGTLPAVLANLFQGQLRDQSQLGWLALILCSPPARGSQSLPCWVSARWAKGDSPWLLMGEIKSPMSSLVRSELIGQQAVPMCEGTND
jgi:hypothetical protein